MKSSNCNNESSLWNEVFFCSLKIESEIIVRALNWKDFRLEFASNNEFYESMKHKTCVILLLSPSTSKIWARLNLYLLRPLVFAIWKKRLENFDYITFSEYAIYPSIDDISIIYELQGSSQSYAADNLLLPAKKPWKKRIQSALSKTPLGNPQINTYALVSKK